MSAIGHQGVFRLNGWSRQIHTEFQGFRVTWGDVAEPSSYVYGGITLYAGIFQSASTSTTVSYSVLVRQNQLDGPTTPRTQRLPAITRAWFGLFRFRSPLLSESLLFSLPVGTEMFHFPTFPPHALCVQARVTPHDWCGVPPFGNPRINARLTAPRGLSQPPTSFIGSWCPGIHRVPLTTWPHKKPHPANARKDIRGRAYTNPAITESEDARVHCAVLNVQPATGHPTPPAPRTPTGTHGGMRCRPALT